ncbi:hypothetical protein MKW92_039886 [Papaver armeniacum]|nr:hypothetical protein MKW92_039886 [Papaver armeniacum]
MTDDKGTRALASNPGYNIFMVILLLSTSGLKVLMSYLNIVDFGCQYSHRYGLWIFLLIQYQNFHSSVLTINFRRKLCFGEYSLNNPVLCRGLEAYGVEVKLKKTKTTSPAWQCNWCLQDACEVPSRSVVGSQASEAKGLHLLMSSTHLYAL